MGKKNDETPTFIADYWELNAVTKNNVYPLPLTDHTLGRLRQSGQFVSMDLKIR